MRIRQATNISRTNGTAGSRQAFQTYWNYLRGWRYVIGEYWVVPEGPDAAPTPVSASNLMETQRSLVRSWSHRKALRVLNEERLSADILPVHPPIAYYAAYHGAKAMLHSFGASVSPTHEGLLRTLGDLASKNRLLRPFSARCTGHPDTAEIEGMPCSFEIPSSNLLLTPDEDELPGFAAWSLKTTHNSRLEAKLEAERKVSARHGKKRLPNGTRDERAAGLKTTTLFDLLYRYRRIAHYGRTDDFAAYGDEIDSAAFGYDLLSVTELTCQMTESAVLSRVGAATLYEWRSNYENRVLSVPAPA